LTEKTGLTVNALTGEESISPLSEEELEFIKVATKQAKEQTKAEEDKVKARESALAKLAALGLTEDEIASL
jgi:DNA-binding NarL/FixJ family response regulator